MWHEEPCISMLRRHRRIADHIPHNRTIGRAAAYFHRTRVKSFLDKLVEHQTAHRDLLRQLPIDRIARDCECRGLARIKPDPDRLHSEAPVIQRAVNIAIFKTDQGTFWRCVDHFDPNRLESRGLFFEGIAPAHQIMVGWIVRRSPSIASVPVQTVAGVHIEADEQNPRSAELRRKIERLKS